MATFTIRISGAEYAGEGETRPEAFAEAVDRAAPVLRKVLVHTRTRGAQGQPLTQRSGRVASERQGARR